MASPGMRNYRLEVAVRRLHGLVNMSSSARIVFSFRFLNFPEIFIRPQTKGGGGVSLPSPDGNRIVSLTYNVCHKAEFHLNDEECRTMFPAPCVCCVYDEEQKHAAMTWDCLCQMTNDPTASRPQSNYAMRDAAGHVMGFAEMSCRVVLLGGVQPPAPDTTSFDQMLTVSPTSSKRINVVGKPYIIRVILDDKKERKKKHSRSTRFPSGGCRQKISQNESTLSTAFINEDVFLKDKIETNKIGNSQGETASLKEKNRGSPSANKKTLYYILHYDIACQIQSSCEILYSTLEREFNSLNAVSVNEKTMPMTEKVDQLVQRVLRLANIVIQLMHQFTAKGCTDGLVTKTIRRNPVNKLPNTREGSVARFLMYQVLFQLQCLGTSIFHLTETCQDSMKIPISRLPNQHVKFIKGLVSDVYELTKCINIIVQSTIDGVLGTNDAFVTTSNSGYSSSFTESNNNNSSNSSSSSSLLCSEALTNKRSEAESNKPLPLKDHTTTVSHFSVTPHTAASPNCGMKQNLQPSLAHTSEVNESIIHAALTKPYAVNTAEPIVISTSTKNQLENDSLLNKSSFNITKLQPTNEAPLRRFNRTENVSVPTPPSQPTMSALSGSPISGSTAQSQPHVGAGSVPVPTPLSQPTMSALSGTPISGSTAQSQPHVGAGSVPVPTPPVVVALQMPNDIHY